MKAGNNNYIARLTNTDAYGMDKRNVGDNVYVHIFEDGSVLLFSQPDRKLKLPTFDIIFNDIEEARKHATCISKTDFDVKSSWDKMMSDRYF